jgi:hypothetical protein
MILGFYLLVAKAKLVKCARSEILRQDVALFSQFEKDLAAFVVL